jgi:uncharacterized protein YjbI with pentapeptide repeats
MPNPKHLARLKKGVKAWNQWRKLNPEIQSDLTTRADLSGANLSGANLREADLKGADFHKANLSGAHLSDAYLVGADLSEANLIDANLVDANLIRANLSGANLTKADLSGACLDEANLSETNLRGAFLSDSDLDWADLTGANLREADLRGADLHKANLSGADLSDAYLVGADLSEANLSGANLSRALLVETNLEESDLTGCTVYGISVWNARLDGATQSNLRITREEEPGIQVDNLEVAQFVYLLLNNAKIRHVIDTITSKVVLILGRFTAERKIVLESIRDELRKRDYVPVLFDFETPGSQTTVETVSTLARMARFVIADLTDAKSILQELQLVVPLSPSLVAQPLLLASQEEPGMFDFFRKFPWVLDTHRYTDQKTLLEELEEVVIAPAESKAKELTQK